jgi:hypothetical protein
MISNGRGEVKVVQECERTACDECTASQTHVLVALDCTLQDLRGNRKHRIGVVVLLADGFRQS